MPRTGGELRSPHPELSVCSGGAAPLSHLMGGGADGLLRGNRLPSVRVLPMHLLHAPRPRAGAKWGRALPGMRNRLRLETPLACEVLAASRTSQDGGVAGVATVLAAGVEVAQRALADARWVHKHLSSRASERSRYWTQAPTLPRVSQGGSAHAPLRHKPQGRRARLAAGWLQMGIFSTAVAGRDAHHHDMRVQRPASVTCVRGAHAAYNRARRARYARGRRGDTCLAAWDSPTSRATAGGERRTAR